MKSVVSIASVIVLVLTGGTEGRTWTSQTGVTIEAEFLGVERDRVWLIGEGEKRLNVSYNALIAEDQALVKQLYNEAREKAAAEAAARQASELQARAAAQAEAEQAKAAAREAVLAKWKPGQVSKHVTAAPVLASYHVYIPPAFDPDKPPPLVYAFSPSGNGLGQLKAMKASAERAGWIVVGCDKLRNGMEENDLLKEANQIEDAILAEVQASVPHDTARVYLSGFSGGAMRSYELTARRSDIPFAGVLAFGGWLGGLEYHKQKFPKKLSVAMVNGDADKNANAWVAPDKRVLKRKGWKVEYFSFPGGHAMAPSEMVDKAIDWIKEQPLPPR